MLITFQFTYIDENSLFRERKKKFANIFQNEKWDLHTNIRQTMQSRACMQLVIIKRMNKTTINDMLK